MLVPRQCRFDIGHVERGFGRKAVKPAAAHECDLIDEHIALRTQFAGIARLTQDACR